MTIRLASVVMLALGMLGCGSASWEETESDGAEKKKAPDAQAPKDASPMDGATADASTKKVNWHPGIYVKLEDWQLTSPAEMADVYQELQDTPSLRGLRVMVQWGRYESRGPSASTSTFDFSELDAILGHLATIGDKYLMLALSWREFNAASGATNLLPNDLRDGVPWNADPTWAHTDFDHLWAYKIRTKTDAGGVHGIYGYNLKLWDPTVKTRMNAFLTALATHLGKHPNLTVISTTESSTGEPIIPFGTGESADAQYAGQLELIRSLHKKFPTSAAIPDFNYSRPYVASVVPLMAAEGFGLASPNINLDKGLNLTSNPPGVLTYYPLLSGKVALAPEIQGIDLLSSTGDPQVPDHPTYAWLYLRARNDLHANYLAIQRNFPYWHGDSKTPSLLHFLQTYPAIVNDATGAGGLDRQLPDNL